LRRTLGDAHTRHAQIRAVCPACFTAARSTTRGPAALTNAAALTVRMAADVPPWASRREREPVS
jgi:hypothetical protein